MSHPSYPHRRQIVERLVAPAVARWLGQAAWMGIVLVALVAARPAFADDVLEGSAVVRRTTQYRGGRQELGGLFGMSLGDPYVRNLLPGVRYDLHLTDWWSIGADLLVGIPVRTAAADDIEKKVSKFNDTFTMEVSRIAWLAGVRTSIAPFTGKAMLLGSLPVQYDVHVNLSLGFASTPGINVAPGSAPPPNYSIAPGVGGGLRVFVSKVVAVTVDLNDVFINRVLSVNRNSQVPGASFEHNLIATAGVSLFFPSDLRRAD